MKKKRDYSTILEEERLILDVTEAIHQLMEEQEVNRVELARLVGVTKGRVSQLLDGKANMTLRTLTRLLGALGHRARVEMEPLDVPELARQPIHANHLYDMVVSWGGFPERSAIVEIKAGGTTVPRSVRSLTPGVTEPDEIDRELQELIAGAA